MDNVAHFALSRASDSTASYAAYIQPRTMTRGGLVTSPSQLQPPNVQNIHIVDMEQKFDHPRVIDDGETGNRTQNLLHSTRAVELDAKKMSYH
jgi:hypothetical protein